MNFQTAYSKRIAKLHSIDPLLKYEELVIIEGFLTKMAAIKSLVVQMLFRKERNNINN